MWKNTQHAHFAEICTNRAPVCVRGVDGSCAKHLTAHVESYTVVMLLTVLLVVVQHPSLFHSRLKTFLSCKSFPPQPFLFFLRTDYVDSPDCLLLLRSISVSYFLVLHFLVVVSVRLIKLTRVSFQANINIASRIVSYSHKTDIRNF